MAVTNVSREYKKMFYDILFENDGVFEMASNSEKKRCLWLKKGHSGHCGEKCRDGQFCDKHLQKIAAGCILRFPCIVCLAGVKVDSLVCETCRIQKGGNWKTLVAPQQASGN